MANKVPPVPYSQPITDQEGRVPEIWADWFKQLLARVGGNTLAGDASASGYQALPSGLVLQWGVTGSVSSATTQAVTFPAPFPSTCLQVMAGVRDNSAGSTANTGHWGTGGYATTGFNLFNRTSAAYVFNWLAVGF